MVPEAIASAHRLHEEGVAANVTNARRLYRTLRQERGQLLIDARSDADRGHLATLITADDRRAPIVTVQDGASHGLAFLGSIYGAPTVPFGMDQWGQSGSREELYEYAGIDVDEIVNAAMLALELNEG